jgi:hypothetical protein
VIQRFCFVKLLDGEVPRRAQLAARVRAALADADVDAVVGIPADASAARWDLSLVVTAATLDAWAALAARADVLAIFDDLAARATVVKAWSFDAPDTAE